MSIKKLLVLFSLFLTISMSAHSIDLTVVGNDYENPLSTRKKAAILLYSSFGDSNLINLSNLLYTFHVKEYIFSAPEGILYRQDNYVQLINNEYCIFSSVSSSFGSCGLAGTIQNDEKTLIRLKSINSINNGNTWNNRSYITLEATVKAFYYNKIDKKIYSSQIQLNKQKDLLSNFGEYILLAKFLELEMVDENLENSTSLAYYGSRLSLNFTNINREYMVVFTTIKKPN